MKKLNKINDLYTGNGKLPPQARDLEEAVLGAVMLEKKAIDIVFPLLEDDFFYFDAHKLIWQGIALLYKQRKPLDILTVTEKLRDLGTLQDAGGPFYVTTLTNRVASAAHVEYHTLLIIEKWIAREMIRICAETYMAMFDDGDVFEKKQKHIIELNRVETVINKNKGNKSWKDQLNITMGMIEKNMDNDDSIAGIPTGDKVLNEITSGWVNGDLIIIGGRPSMGKTAFALHLMTWAVKYNYIIKFYSLEMSFESLTMRVLSSESEINHTQLRSGNISPDELMLLRDVETRLLDLPIKINDNSRMTVYDISADARITKLTEGLDLVFVDYLQLISSPVIQGQTREQQVSTISRELKALAKELRVPVIALSQLSRDNEKNGDKRPQLGHLRDSGSIEQDADEVIFCYRPAYYTGGDQTKDPDPEYKALSQEVYQTVFEAIVRKNRNGETDTALLRWIGSRQKFESWK